MRARCVVFVEPIALYHTRDLYDDGDEQWLAPYQPAGAVPIGSARTYGDGTDLTILTFGNGVPMSLRVARRLAGRDIDGPRGRPAVAGARSRSTDMLRRGRARPAVCSWWTRRGAAEGSARASSPRSSITAIAGALARVAGDDSFIPLGDAALHVLLCEDTIEAAALELVEGRR